jgi:hypothetical protein
MAGHLLCLVLPLLLAINTKCAGIENRAHIFESVASPKPLNKLDELVFGHLGKLGIQPANICSDGVFVRRAFLDVIGTLPTEEEAKEFLLNKDPKKRAALIETLLSREEFADYWSMKWCDLLRVKAEFPVNLWPNAVQAYHHWIRASIKENKPYDQFVRQMLTASGSNFRAAPVNFYRAIQKRDPSGIAEMVALTFMGTRAEKWPTNQLNSMAAFFSCIGYKSTGEWKEEIVFWDVSKARTNLCTSGVFPGGTVVDLSPNADPRAQFADWLVDPKNPWFTRNIANRVWSWLLGRGIIHEPDDIRPENPPSNPQLLAFLEQSLIDNRYDLRKLFKLILGSQTYQLSCVAKSDPAQAAQNFAVYPLRRLEAEVLIDALNQVTWMTDSYSSAIPEPYTFLPGELRAIAIPDGSITTPFFEMFGRPSRDTGLEGERNNQPSAAQRLHLLNSSHIQGKIEASPTLMETALSQAPQREIATSFYLTILSRFPTDDELQALAAYSKQNGIGRREFAVDLAWVLINSSEFLYRH